MDNNMESLKVSLESVPLRDRPITKILNPTTDLSRTENQEDPYDFDMSTWLPL